MVIGHLRLLIEGRYKDKPLEIDIDIEPWLRFAAEDMIETLAARGWYYQPNSIFDSVFTCSLYVDPQEALEYLLEHRPALAYLIQTELL